MNVSIIIPAYNAAATISDTLESVRLQTFANWEAIVVDDGSCDATAIIAERFAAADPRIRVIRQPNGGESAARNTGIDHAFHEWLLFLDADDWISPSHLEKMTGALASDPLLNAVHCEWVRVAQDGTLVSSGYTAPEGDLFPTLARRPAFAVHACVVRKSLVLGTGGFDPSITKSADWDLWQRIGRTGARFGAVREVLAYYRMLPNSASQDAPLLLQENLRILERGHSRDPRVPNPAPPHAAGLPGPFESQKFYLLCWSAGLLIGATQDATGLLGEVSGDRYAALSPEGVARCIFDSATLPACEPPERWEKLWPRASALIERFLEALEMQSGTPNLATDAVVELKRLILRRSPMWRAAMLREDSRHIEELERIVERLQGDIAELAQETRNARQIAETLEFEADRWRRLARDRGEALEILQERSWVRLGQKLKLLRRQEAAVPSPGPAKNGVDRKTWQLRAAPGNSAALTPVPKQPDVVRVSVGRASSRTRWDIQLNRPHVRVNADLCYALHCRLRSDARRTIGLGVAQAHAPWTNLGLYKVLELTPDWQEFKMDFTAAAAEPDARIHFDIGGEDIAVEVSDVRLEEEVRAAGHAIGHARP